MILEYDQNGSFHGRLDGSSARLEQGYWIMTDTHQLQNTDQQYLKKTNIKQILNRKTSQIVCPLWAFQSGG